MRWGEFKSKCLISSFIQALFGEMEFPIVPSQSFSKKTAAKLICLNCPFRVKLKRRNSEAIRLFAFPSFIAVIAVLVDSPNKSNATTKSLDVIQPLIIKTQFSIHLPPESKIFIIHKSSLGVFVIQLSDILLLVILLYVKLWKQRSSFASTEFFIGLHFNDGEKFFVSNYANHRDQVFFSQSDRAALAFNLWHSRIIRNDFDEIKIQACNMIEVCGSRDDVSVSEHSGLCSDAISSLMETCEQQWSPASGFLQFKINESRVSLSEAWH